MMATFFTVIGFRFREHSKKDSWIPTFLAESRIG
jgi:hypothetical protein